MNKKTKKILKILEQYSKMHWSRKLEDPFQILIKTILSQRTRDETTERISSILFQKAKTPKQILALPTKKLQKIIKPIGFYKQKSKKIKELCKILIKNYKGKVPRSRQELIVLPGVGPKTADVVLCYAFKKPNIAIDVHVNVTSKRLGLVQKDVKYEETRNILEKTFKGKERVINHGFVEFGRQICLTSRPKCLICNLNKICDYYNEREKKD